MTSFRFRRFAPIAALLIAAAAWVGCKQGEGERCQIDSDCADGLICNQATQSCAETTGGGIDASVPDMTIDAPVDAAIDAPIDMPIDAI